MAAKNPTKHKHKVIRTEHPHIVRIPGVRGGEPIIKGSTISVWIIASFHKTGDTVEAISRMYSHLPIARIYDALSYYYDHKDEIEKRLAENKYFHEHFDEEMEKEGYTKIVTEKGVVLWKKIPDKNPAPKHALKAKV